MKSIKRAPLLGGIGILIIIIALITMCIIGGKPSEPTKTEENNIVQLTPEEIKEVEETVTETTKEKITPQPKPKEIIPENNPTPKVVEAPQTDASSSDNGTGLGQFKITAYCNCSKCCGKWAGGPTASGTMPTAGKTIAVDPRIIPLGTKVIIDGHTYVAEDTGGAIKGNKIDMYFNSHSEALQWGVKYKNVSLAN